MPIGIILAGCSVKKEAIPRDTTQNFHSTNRRALALWPQGGAPNRQPSLQVEWLYYGGDPRNSKHSPLTDVNGGNIQRLQIAWQWKHWFLCSSAQ
jgi:glucose dehydrogenase